MKQKHLLSLLQQGMTTIAVQFLDGNSSMQAPAAPPPAPRRAPEPWAQPHPGYEAPRSAPVKTYTYKAPVGLLKEGDTVVVPSTYTNAGLAFALVVRVDPVARIDVDAEFDYKWIVQKVDRVDYDKRVDDELAFADTLQVVEATRQREQLLATMTEHLPQGTQARALFDDAISRLATPAPTIAAPAAFVPAPASEGGMACK